MRGALFMVISMAAFTVNDSITKLVASSFNMGQVMLVRGLFATILVVAIAWHQNALRPLSTAFEPALITRVLCEALATTFFLIALAHLPLANVSAVLQALPLAVTMGAALYFGEQVGWRRWLAIATGFAGVLIVVRPGFSGFNAYALLALASVACCAVRDLATKSIPNEIPSLFISVATSVAVTMTGAFLVVPLGGWSTPSAGDLTLLASAAVLLVIGYQFIIKAMREGSISFIAPFRYTALLWSLALGYAIFGDIPDTAMAVGATVVVGSGLYTLYREQIVGRGKPAAETTSPAMAPDGL